MAIGSVLLLRSLFSERGGLEACSGFFSPFSFLAGGVLCRRQAFPEGETFAPQGPSVVFGKMCLGKDVAGPNLTAGLDLNV